MGSAAPLRIDLFDDEIEAIRRFDPETQRSLDSLEHGAVAAGARGAAGCGWRAGVPSPLSHALRGRSDASEDLSRRQRRPRAGGHRVLSAAVLRRPRRRCSTICRATRLSCMTRRSRRRLRKAWHDIEARYEDRRHDIERPGAGAAELFIEPEELAARSRRSPPSRSMPSRPTPSSPGAAAVHNFPPPPPRELRIDARAEQPFAPLDAFLRAFEGRVLIAADSAGRREVLQEMLRAHRPRGALVPAWESFARRRGAPGADGGARHRGTHAHDLPPIAVISESQLSARAPARSVAASAPPSTRKPFCATCRISTRRAGRARGVRRRPLRRAAADGGRRASPASSSCSNTWTATASTCRCTRCTWSAATPAPRPRARRCTSSAPISGRGRAGAPPSRSATWPRSCSTCTRGARRSRDSSSPLTEPTTRPSPTPSRSRRPRIRPRRSARCWRISRASGRWTASCAATSASARPRWRCAPRSPPSQAGKQVAVLVPTTLLAQQHLTNFRDRFADWPVRVEALSRFGNSQGNAGGPRGHRAAARSTS